VRSVSAGGRIIEVQYDPHSSRLSYQSRVLEFAITTLMLLLMSTGDRQGLKTLAERAGMHSSL
jgi:hypothetical protein